MKLTVKKLTQIIREEVSHVLKEARYYTPGGKDDPHDTRNYSTRNPDRDYERWFEKGDVPMPGSGRQERPSEDPNEDKDWEVGTFVHIVEKFLNDRGYDYRHEDIDHEHIKELNAAMNPDDEGHKALMDAIEWSHQYTKPGYALKATPKMFKEHMELLNQENRGINWFQFRVDMLN